MALTLKDLMAKAASKGITAEQDNDSSPLLKPWQQESVLFDKKQEETTNKVAPNRNQSGSTTVTKVASNRNQTVTKKEPEISNRNQSGSTTVTTTVTKVAPNRNQSGSKSSLHSLVGLQRSSLYLIYESCKSTRSNLSHSLTLEYFASSLNTSTKAVKTAIQRLTKKVGLVRAEFKNGRGGWTKYQLPDELYQEMLHSETVTKVAPNRNQSGPTTVTTTVTKPLSSSSNNYNKTTTTELPLEWLDINITPLDEIGFTKNYLSQLYKANITSSQEVQASIEHFAFDIKANNKLKDIKTNPLSYFMGIMKRSGLYLAPGNYISPRDKAINEMLKVRKKQAEMRRKQFDELFSTHFDVWFEQQTDNFLKTLLPHAMTSNYKRSSGMVVAAAKEHFKESDGWQQILNELDDLSK